MPRGPRLSTVSATYPQEPSRSAIAAEWLEMPPQPCSYDDRRIGSASFRLVPDDCRQVDIRPRQIAGEMRWLLSRKVGKLDQVRQSIRGRDLWRRCRRCRARTGCHRRDPCPARSSPTRPHFPQPALAELISLGDLAESLHSLRHGVRFDRWRGGEPYQGSSRAGFSDAAEPGWKGKSIRTCTQPSPKWP